MECEQIACGMGHSIYLSKCGKLFVTGRGLEGQLGLGKDKKQVSQWEQIQLTNNSNNNDNNNENENDNLNDFTIMNKKIKFISCGLNYTLIVATNKNGNDLVFKFGSLDVTSHDTMKKLNQKTNNINYNEKNINVNSNFKKLNHPHQENISASSFMFELNKNNPKFINSTNENYDFIKNSKIKLIYKSNSNQSSIQWIKSGPNQTFLFDHEEEKNKSIKSSLPITPKPKPLLLAFGYGNNYQLGNEERTNYENNLLNLNETKLIKTINLNQLEKVESGFGFSIFFLTK
jgi:alpha-tubulin suppressor-like RCC1 family protein